MLATHGYDAPGNYSVWVELTDSDGEVARANSTIAVGTELNVSFTTSNLAIGLGQTISLQNYVSGGEPPYVYWWTGLPPGCSNNGLATVTCVPSQAGLFQITATVWDDAFDSLTGHPTVSHAVELVVGNASGPHPGSTSGTVYVALTILSVGLVVAAVLLVRRSHPPGRSGSGKEVGPGGASRSDGPTSDRYESHDGPGTRSLVSVCVPRKVWGTKRAGPILPHGG